MTNPSTEKWNLLSKSPKGLILRRFTTPTAAVLFLFCAATSLRAGPIADSPVFAMLVGDWEGEGELTNPDDGHVTQVKETWTGELTSTGNFEISGKRLFDQNEHEFAWEFYANDDLIEGQMKVSNPEVNLRFEAQVDEVSRSVTIKVELTGGGGIMTIVNTISEDGRSIEGTVELVDESGKTTTTGKVAHKKS